MPTVVLIAFTVPPMTPVVSSDTVENANSIFNMCKDTTIPVASYNVMLTRPSRGFVANWKMLGRSLGVSEADMYAIWCDHAYSVTEQAMQMFQRWIEMTASGACQEKNCPPEKFYPRTKIFSDCVENFCPTLKIFVRLAKSFLPDFSSALHVSYCIVAH